MDINVLKTGSIYKGYQTLTGHGIISLFLKTKWVPLKSWYRLSYSISMVVTQ